MIVMKNSVSLRVGHYTRKHGGHDLFTGLILPP